MNVRKCQILYNSYILGEGNVSVAGEYNFHTDPEAAKVVLNDLKCPLTLVGWELCRDLGLSWVSSAGQVSSIVSLNTTFKCMFHGNTTNEVPLFKK